ncbi:MAG: EAL domain-containing protein [Actinobacteria bacterium]|nr:EAL domain-containing protein [Actinomycetota bacterium]
MTPPEVGAGDVDQVRVLERRLARERAARAEAEAVAERATSELYETVQQLTRSTRVAELLTEVAARANEAASVQQAARAALASVCGYTGWPVGHALVRSTIVPEALTSAGVWHLDDEQACAGFRAVSEELVFLPGVGLPGQILQTGAPLWAPELDMHDKFARKTSARDGGLRAGFGIPVLIRSETVAVLEFFAHEIRPPDEDLLRVVGFVGAQLARVLEREAAEERLRQLALFDALTGLPNRMLLMDRLRVSMERSQHDRSRVDVLYLDIDDFKTINDSQGHQAGDEVLTAVATHLSEAVRQTDCWGRPVPSTVARLGGDEFAIVLDDCPDPKTVAARIQKRLAEPLRLEANEVFLGVSIGTARAEDGAEPEDVLAAANVAMHAAKHAGKGQYVVFAPHMQVEARRRHSLGEQLHRAIDNEEFFLAYQPVVDLDGGQIIGVEALVRWRHPSGRVAPPDEFIPRAEETGLILPLGRWVLSQACRQAALWRQQFAADFSMAVNVSGRQLREPDFPELVRSTLRTTGLDPGDLCLEMTESILMEHDDGAIAMLTELRQDGIHLAIDDFGTGYSSLAALRRLPFDIIKIDRSFVSALPEDDAGTIAWAVVRLGHTLDICVLAEGVETAEQRDALVSFGCDRAQGFLFGRPLPPEELEGLLAAQALPRTSAAVTRPRAARPTGLRARPSATPPRPRSVQRHP